MQYSQEHLKTMVYAEFGGQTECIMGNSKIVNAGDKDWDDQCWRPLLFSYRNSIPGSTSGHVARASTAYDHENQALRKTQELLSFT